MIFRVSEMINFRPKVHKSQHLFKLKIPAVGVHVFHMSCPGEAENHLNLEMRNFNFTKRLHKF